MASLSNIATSFGLVLIVWLISDLVWRSVLVLIILYLLYMRYERSENLLPPEDKAVLITGCGSGIGHEMAKAFVNKGFYVYAGCRDANQAGAKTLQDIRSDRLKVLQLDITKTEDIDNSVQTVRQDGRGLWGLINNAGVHLIAETELAPIEAFQKHFDVNCLGSIRMVKALLPLLKQSKGRIINIGTISTRVYGSMLGAYNISKVGAEAFSDVLRLEMIKWGIKVSYVYLGPFNTKMARFPGQIEYFEGIQRNLSESQKQYFNDVYFNTVMDRIQEMSRHVDSKLGGMMLSSDFSPVFIAVEQALLSSKPKARYYAGRGARTLVTLYTQCPNWILDMMATASPIIYREKGILVPENMQFE